MAEIFLPEYCVGFIMAFKKVNLFIYGYKLSFGLTQSLLFSSGLSPGLIFPSLNSIWILLFKNPEKPKLSVILRLSPFFMYSIKIDQNVQGRVKKLCW